MARSRSLWLIVLAGTVGLLATACSVDEALALPDCTEGGTALIVAQSVPSAELIPCFEALPAGWEVDAVHIDQRGTTVQLDSDRAGLGSATLRYFETCEPGQAVSVPSEQDGAEAFEYIGQIDPGFQAQRYYLFPGGCVWWDFNFDNGASATYSVELQERLVLLTRVFVNRNLAESFLDEEL